MGQITTYHSDGLTTLSRSGHRESAGIDIQFYIHPRKPHINRSSGRRAENENSNTPFSHKSHLPQSRTEREKRTPPHKSSELLFRQQRKRGRGKKRKKNQTPIFFLCAKIEEISAVINRHQSFPFSSPSSHNPFYHNPCIPTTTIQPTRETSRAPSVTASLSAGFFSGSASSTGAELPLPLGSKPSSLAASASSFSISFCALAIFYPSYQYCIASQGGMRLYS